MSKLSSFFIKNAAAVCEKNGLMLNITGFDNEFDAYLSMVEAGIEQDEIISQFESAINLSFVDIREESLAESVVAPNRMADLVNSVRVFPFMSNSGSVKVAISNPEQMEYTENIMNTSNFSFVFSFQFLIDEKLSDIKVERVETGLDYTEKSLTKISGDRKRIILASGEDAIDTLISESEMFTVDFLTTQVVQNRGYLEEYCLDDHPDILLIGDNIGGKGSLTEIMLRLHTSLPDMRIVYLCGEVDPKDVVKKMMLGSLAAAGIYDIIAKNDISVLLLQNILKNPYTEEDATEWLEYIKDSAVKKKNTISVFVPDVVETDESVTIYPNLYTFTSPKGGVGKSFLIEQLAVAIATSGIPNSKGSKPRVGIIDLDFEGFSISKFFNTIHEKDNIFAAIEESKKIVNDLGNADGVDTYTEKLVNENLHKLFRPTSKYPNIKILGGNDLMYHTGDRKILNNYVLTYIFETVIDDFDVLFVDANTDMDTSIIYPLFSMSANTYFVLDMDWNTFHNNKRFIMHLDNEELYIPTQTKFILNKAISSDLLPVSIADIEAGLGIEFSAIIPNIDPAIIFALNSKGGNMIQLDNKMNEEKYYFMKLANEIYPIANFADMYKSFENKIKFKLTKRRAKDDGSEDSGDSKKKPQAAEEPDSKGGRGFLGGFFRK